MALAAREGELAMAIAQEAISMKEKFYTEGPVELRQARLEVCCACLRGQNCYMPGKTQKSFVCLTILILTTIKIGIVLEFGL